MCSSTHVLHAIFQPFFHQSCSKQFVFVNIISHVWGHLQECPCQHCALALCLGSNFMLWVSLVLMRWILLGWQKWKQCCALQEAPTTPAAKPAAKPAAGPDSDSPWTTQSSYFLIPLKLWSFLEGMICPKGQMLAKSFGEILEKVG